MITPPPKKSDRIEKVFTKDGFVFLQSEHALIRIAFYFEDVVRISYSENGLFDSQQGEGMLLDDLIANPDFSLIQDETKIQIQIYELIVQVCRATGAVKIYRLNGDAEQVLFCEAQAQSHVLEKFDVYKNIGQVKTEEVQTADGVKKRIVAADKEYVESLYHTTLNFNFASQEKLFGLGQAEEGIWNLRGTTQYLCQANKKIAIPFLISSLGYGLLFSTQSPAIFEDTQYGSYFYTNADYYLDYFAICPKPDTKKAGTVFSKIIARMRSLTGKATLPPDYALGYVQSQERYETQQEILATATEFKNRNIPLSLIVQDWLSWDDGMWGQKSFDKKRYPDVPAMIKTLHQEDVHFMISIWPTMDEKSENYKEMKEKNALLTGVNICNAFDSAARNLYWAQAKKGLADLGVESWWCDSSEPVTPEWNHYAKQPANKIFEEYLRSTGDIMPPQKANAYGLYHARGMFEGQARDFPDRQMLILTRSGWPGSQRYGVTLWSGDTSAKWSVLKNQVVQACQFGLSGIPYWTVDIGGFFVKTGAPWYWNGDYQQAAADPAYRELYTRWFQFGAFLPMFRAHGTDCRREPWAFCDETNVYYDTLVKFIKLRYKLMPYIKEVARRVTENDESFIRPLFMEFDDAECFDICTQYMFGPAIMVCPVTEPDCSQIDVYLPANGIWTDFWTGEKFDGGQWIKKEVTLDKIPLFLSDNELSSMDCFGSVSQ